MDTQKDRQLLAVVFTDIQGFSALTQKNEQKALQEVTRYRNVVTEQTQVYRGEIVHFFGDGSLSVHASALDAVQCAIQIQQAFADDIPIPVRIGIHLGEVVIAGETVYGNAVNIASRLQHLASAHSILVSGPIAKELENHPEIKMTFVTEEYVKNINEPVDIHAIVHPDLVTPLRKEIHERGVIRKPKTYLAIAIVIIAIGLYFIADHLDLFPRRLLDQKILVLPFENKTGDSTLQNFSLYAAAYVSRLMEQEDDIKIVTAREILDQPNPLMLSSLSYGTISMKTNARNFIDGYFTFDEDSLLLLTAGLLDSKSGNYIKQFDTKSVDPENPNDGLVQLTQDILGFLISADYKPLSPPTKDAFSAYMEALRLYSANNYQDTRHFLREAIRYDSTFIDAYFILTDTYHNTSDYDMVDSMLAEIKKRFPIELQSARERNSYYFYEAFNSGNNVAAYKYILIDYNQNKKNLFKNTTAASFALYFVNAPDEALRILRKIPANNIDYRLPDQQYRLTVEVQANCALGRYKKAAKLVDLYPTRDMTIDQHKMRIRVLAGINDLEAIQSELKLVKLNFDVENYVMALYWTVQQFILLGEDIQRQQYLDSAYSVIAKNNLIKEQRIQVLYGMGRYQEGLDFAKFLLDSVPTEARLLCHVSRGFALTGELDSARYFCDRIREQAPVEWYRGQNHYLEACCFTAMGDYQIALIKLRNAVDDGLIFFEDHAAFDPRLMPLFDLPEFDEIIHPLGSRPR